MKVRLLPLAAVAAVAMGAQGFAQSQGDDLDRALADLNSSVAAPLPGSVDAPQSSSLSFSGSARARNTWLNPAGMAGNQKAIDVRIVLNMGFEVTQDSRAFLSFNGAEGWGTISASSPTLGTQPGPNNPGNPADTGSLEQAWFQADNLIGDGGTATIGRKFFTVGAGRIIGTDEWDQTPHAYAGMWYENGADDWNVNLFMIQDIFFGHIDGGQGNGDIDLFGFSFDYHLKDLPGIGDINMTPYLLRMSDRNTLTPGSYKNWYGASLNGALPFAGITYDAELVWAHDNAMDTTDKAWALDLSLDLEQVIGEMPESLSPTLELGIAAADDLVAINPSYHNTAGIYDLLGRGGVWGGAADTWQAHLGVEPMEGWEGRIGYLHFNENNKSGLDGWELDVEVGHELNGNVQAWFGWAMVDQNRNASKDYVVYGMLGLPF